MRGQSSAWQLKGAPWQRNWGFSVGDNLGATVIVGDESKPMLVYLRGRTSICSYLRVHQGSMVLTHICQEISHNISPTYCCFGVTPRVVRGARNS